MWALFCVISKISVASAANCIKVVEAELIGYCLQQMCIGQRI